MIPHFIVHPERPIGVQFFYDFTERTTRWRHFKIDRGELRVVARERQVPYLARFPAAATDAWITGMMEAREWGAPSFVEFWDWESGERLRRASIQHERLGLTGLALSPDATRLLVDRIDGRATIFDVGEMRPIAGIELNAHLGGPTFERGGDRLALVHTDQGSGEAHVYAIGAGAATLVQTVASDQIGDDTSVGAVAFLPGDELLVWSVRCFDAQSAVAVYRIGDGGARFSTELTRVDDDAKLQGIDGFDVEAFDNLVFNTQLAVAIDGARAYVGGVGEVVAIDLARGAVTGRTRLSSPGFVVQVRACGGRLLAHDHLGALEVVPSFEAEP